MSQRDQITVEVGSEGRRTAVAAVLWAHARELARQLIDTSPRPADLVGRVRTMDAHDRLVPLRELVVALGRLERVELGDHSVALPLGHAELARRIDWLLSLSDAAPQAAATLAPLLDELRHWRSELD